MNAAYKYGDEVARALAAKTPVVALETTVVTHGLPHPEGVTTARSLEEVVRRAGATPATIGIIGGAIRIGLTHAELEQLATTPNVAKINLSNLAAAVSSGQPGSTTVAAT
jgi:pseudouridine-5'-phosphate glycosidase